MTREEYIKMILGATSFSKKTKRRIEADLQTDITARLDAGKSMQEVMEEMGSPAEVAQSLKESMPNEAGGAKSPWRWVLLGLAVLLVLAAATSSVWSGWLAGSSEVVRPLMYSVDTPRIEDEARMSVYFMSFGFRVPVTTVLSYALCAFCGFLMLQWKGAKKDARFLVTGVVMAAWAVMMLVGGLSGAMMENFLISLQVPILMLSRLVNPAFWLPLLLGVLCIRRWVKGRKTGAQPMEVAL